MPIRASYATCDTHGDRQPIAANKRQKRLDRRASMTRTLKDMRIALLSVVAATLAPRSTEACICDGTRHVSPTQDVPLHGTIYVKDEVGSDGLRSPYIRWYGPSGHVSKTRLSPNDVRIEYRGPAGTTLMVDNNRFRLRDDWRRSERAPRVIDTIHVIEQSSDYELDVVNMALDQTVVGVRARWTHEGRRREWLSVPRTPDNVIMFGDIVCGATNPEPEELWKGGHLELTAIYADGSERDVAMPARFSSAAMLQHVTTTRPTYTATIEDEKPLGDVRELAPRSTTSRDRGVIGALLFVLAVFVTCVRRLTLSSRAP
jgi:hypothetical protein